MAKVSRMFHGSHEISRAATVEQLTAAFSQALKKAGDQAEYYGYEPVWDTVSVEKETNYDEFGSFAEEDVRLIAHTQLRVSVLGVK